ncbi:uncharacterized protein [Bemisia tabaci]|uniref:uncharacterized protein n=1 Tax=Bemisia tabaci TaxID=7038 RepID=UPI003B282FC5
MTSGGFVTSLVRNIVTAKNDVIIDSFEEAKLGDTAKHYISVPVSLTVKGRYKHNDAPFEVSFFAKRRLDNPSFLEGGLARLFGNEKFVYERLLPALEQASGEELPRPTFYGASEDYLLLQNLVTSGYQTADIFAGADLELTRLVLQKLACYHASSLKLKREKPESYATMTKAMPVSFMLQWLDTFRQYSDSTILPAFDALAAGGLTEIAEYIRAHGIFTFDGILSFFSAQAQDEGLNLFIHGDTKLDNMMFLYRNEGPASGKVVDFKFIDFQTVRECSILVDVLLFLGTSVNVEVFASSLDDLLEFYLAEFLSACQRMHIAHPPTREAFRRELRRISGGALLAIAWYLPIHTMDFNKDVDWGSVDIEEMKEKLAKADRARFNAKFQVYAATLAQYFMDR